MVERRNWEQMKRDNVGAPWIVNGEFCGNYKRTSVNAAVNALHEQDREMGLKEWQMAGFNGCWSCDHNLACQYNIHGIQ